MGIQLDAQVVSQFSWTPTSGGDTTKNVDQEWTTKLSKTDIAVRAKDRIDKKVAQMGEQVMQEQGEIAPDVTEFVDGPEESREDASQPADDGRRAETRGEQEIRFNFGAGTEEQRKEAKRRRDLDTSGKDIKGN